LPEVSYKGQPPLIIKENKAIIIKFEKSIELKEKNIITKGKINYKDCTSGFR
jgi:cytochrome c-type biogenesis protein CcmE